MARDLTQSVIFKLLNWAYDAALTGYPSVSSAQALAEEYLKEPDSQREQANSLIRWQIAKTAGSGFLTGLGGVLTIPVTLPAELGAVYFIQLRMITAIAVMGGYDVKSQQVRTLSYVCLLGSAATDVLGQIVSEIGAELGEKITQDALEKLSREVITSVDEKVSTQLLAKATSKSVFRFGRIIPILGGLFSAGLNGLATNEIGDSARDLFLPKTRTRAI
ncbi:MAG: hypothetical protein RL701_5235 [Pseudomonadota bacterium]|jgi:hypothetical protein